MKQSLRWAIGEKWFIPDNNLVKNANLMISNAIEKGELKLFDGIVENLRIELLKEMHKQKFFCHHTQIIVAGLTYRSESDVEFLNWIQQINSLKIMQMVKKELALMYEAQEKIESN